MMRAVLILLPFIGMCNGLWLGLEYLYKYNARVQVDIMDIRPAISAASVKCDIIVQVLDRDTLAFKFNNVLVADINTDRECDEWSHLPPLPQFEHKPLQDQAFLLEKPFKITVQDGPAGGGLMPVIDVPAEPAWVTNMRKAMIEIFNNKVLKINYGLKRNLFDMGRFAEDEETIFGDCSSSYTLNILSDGFAVYYGKMLENMIDEDFQAPEVNDGSKYPILEDRLWRSRRKIEMTQCSSFVNVRNLGHQNECVDNPSRCKKNANGRSSTALMYFRGGPSGVRMEYAEVTDFTLVEPYPAHTEQIKVVTNKTLELFYVRPITQALRPEIGKQTTWRFDVVPNAAYQTGPFRQPTYEEIFTQFALEPNQIDNLKEKMMQWVNSINIELSDPTTTDITGAIDDVAQNINYLSLSDIRELYSQLQYEAPANAETFLKMLVTSGSEQANTFLLRMLADGQLSAELKTSFYMNMAAVLQSANFILDFMDYIINVPQTDDLDTLGILSMSVLANNCLKPDRRRSYQDVSCGGQGCDPVVIVQKFVPFLQQGLNNEGLETWRRLVYMQAIVNLKSPYIIDILRPYVLGAVTSDLSLRVNAIQGINKKNMPGDAKTECLHLLMTVFDDLHEHHEVRSAAFITMVSWNPSPSWWHTLALISWKEPNRQLASLIGRVIRYTATLDKRQMDTAVLVSPLARPSPPASLSFPFLINYGYQSSAILGVSWMDILLSSRNDNVFPRRVAFMFQAFRASTYFPQTTLLKNAAFDVYGIDEVWRSVSGYFSKPDPDADPDPAIKIVQGMYNQIMIKLDAEGKKKPEKASILLYAKLLHYFQFLIPAEFTADDIINAPDRIRTLPAQINLNLQLFGNYGRIKWIFPTSIGISAMVEASSPNAASIVGTFGVKPTDGNPDKFEVYLDAVTKLAYKTMVTCKAMIPWERKSLMAGIDNTMSFNLPLNLQLSVDTGTMDLSLIVTPKTRAEADQQELELISVKNVPFTVRVPIMPYQMLNKNKDYKQIYQLGYVKRMEEARMPDRTGMVLISRRTDFQNPMVNLFPLPAPTFTLRSWSWQLLWNVAKSDSKSVGFFLNYAYLNKGSSSPRAPNFSDDMAMMDLTDARGLSDDFEPRTREPYRPRPYGVPGVKWRRERMFTEAEGPEEEEGQGRVRRQAPTRYGGRRRGYGGPAAAPAPPPDVEDFGSTDTMSLAQRAGASNVQVIQDNFNFDLSPVVRSLSARAEFYGGQTRSFEAIVTWAAAGQDDLFYSKFNLGVFQSAIGVDPPYTTCLNINSQWPWILPLTTVKEYLEVASNGGSLTFDAAITTDDCFNGKAAMSMEGEFYLSEDGISYIADTLASNEQCDFTEDDAVVVLRHRFFDNFRWDAALDDNLPVGLVNATYQAGDFFSYYLWPYIYFDHMKKNDPNGLVVTGQRSYYDSRWNINVAAPSDTAYAERVLLPTQFEDVFGPLPFWDVFTEEMLVGAVPRVCKISDTRMITFDGAFVGAGPDVCWVVAARDCSDNGDWQVQVRNTGAEIAAKIIWPSGGIVVDITQNVVKINSQTMTEKDIPENALYKFFKKGDTMYFMFAGEHYLRISNEIQFGASKWYRGKVCGVCGDMNGEMLSDMQGPRSCVYTDPKLFVLSWTISGDGCAGCNPFELSFRKLDVTNYQKVCPKRVVRPTAEIYPSLDSPAIRSCTSWVYQEKMVNEYLCVSTQATPVCRPGCKDANSLSRPIEYECQLAQSFAGGRKKRQAWLDTCPTGIHYRSLLTTYSGPCMTPLE